MGWKKATAAAPPHCVFGEKRMGRKERSLEVIGQVSRCGLDGGVGMIMDTFDAKWRHRDVE